MTIGTPGNDARVWAVVPAAGRGTRMRTSASAANAPCKQLESVGGEPMLVKVLNAIEASRLAGCCIVVNPEIVTSLEVLRPANPRRIYAVNDRPDSEMIESIQLGLGAVRPGMDGYLICPGDHPCITTAVIDICLDAFEQNPSRIVIASHRGRRGHPLILPADLAFDVQSWPPSRGLNEIRTLHADRVRIVEVPDAGILIDVDTPSDLETARERLQS